ncbi:ATP-binding protein [Pseudomonas putida]|uniref:ATP-binding protein n=1 Tax=Pseudomonas putida TaxID=303 RepID=UPI003FD2300F
MVFFLAGVHGVGKTSLCSRLAETLKIPSISASQLIKQQGELEAWTSDKKTVEITSNQQKLLSAIRTYEKQTEAWLLDGHFALLDHSGRITQIEQNVFYAMHLSAVVFIEDDPFSIALRLEKRDNVQWDAGLINKLQQAEKEGALNFCKKTNTPLLIATPSDFEQVREFIIKGIAKYSINIKGLR